MVLNEFKTQQITWDKATKKFHEKIEANSGDTNGRKLKVQIINNSLIEDLTGVELNLAWRTKDNSNFGLDVFKVIDATKGIFEILYTTEMLSNVKKLKASLVMIDSTGRTESNEFDIDIKPSVVNDGAVQSQNSFTALTSALVKVNEWNGRIDAVEQDYADRAEALEQTYAPKLTEVTAQLAQIGANAKDYGAIGDGLSHPLSDKFTLLSEAKKVYSHANALDNEIDWCAIQEAVNVVIKKGGGRVIVPTGRYVTNKTIELDSNIEFCGAGRYITTFFPTYFGPNGFSDLIRINGSESERKRNVVVRDFGIDGSNLEFYVENEGEPAFEAGQWARIVPRYVDNFVAHDIYCYHGSHVFQMSGCDNFLIDRIRCDYNFNVVHMTAGNNRRGIITNIVATRVACVIDWGAGGNDVEVSNIYGNNEGYIRNDQEAVDVGGAKNVKISNAIFENFNFGVTVKGEQGGQWDNVEFENVTFKNFKQYGIRATFGTEPTSGRLKITNCDFISDSMPKTKTYYGVEFIGDNINSILEMKNVTIKVNGGGIRAIAFKQATLNEINIESGERGVYFEAPGGIINGDWSIKGIKIISGGAPIELVNNKTDALLADFEITAPLVDTPAIFIRGVSFPKINRGVIHDVGNHAIHLQFELFNLQNPNSLNGLLAEVSEVDVRNWGKSTGYRAGLMFTIPSVTGSFKGLKLRNLSFQITEESNTQNGIVWNGFGSNKIEYSRFESIDFYRVPTEQSGINYKGLNNVENYISIK